MEEGVIASFLPYFYLKISQNIFKVAATLGSKATELCAISVCTLMTFRGR
jgi:hypothetical protein